MNIGERELELIARLRQLQPLIDRGFDVDDDTSRIVVIAREGHVYGMWLVTDLNFAYVPGGYNEPTHFAASVEEAVAIMHAVFDTPGT